MPEVGTELVEDGAVFPQLSVGQVARRDVGQAVDQVVDVFAYLAHGHAGGVLEVVRADVADGGEHALGDELGVAALVGALVALLQPDDEPVEVVEVHRRAAAERLTERHDDVAVAEAAFVGFRRRVLADERVRGVRF